MKKKRLILIFGLIITMLLVIFLFYNRSTNVNPLKDENVLNIKVINISNPSEGYSCSVTKQEDINILFKLLKSIKLNRQEYINLDGVDYIIYIKPHNEEAFAISLFSDNIRINNQNYKSNKDYSDDIKKVFDDLSNKYPKEEIYNSGM